MVPTFCIIHRFNNILQLFCHHPFFKKSSSNTSKAFSSWDVFLSSSIVWELSWSVICVTSCWPFSNASIFCVIIANRVSGCFSAASIVLHLILKTPKLVFYMTKLLHYYIFIAANESCSPCPWSPEPLSLCSPSASKYDIVWIFSPLLVIIKPYCIP